MNNTKRFTRIAMVAAIYAAVSFVPVLSSFAFGPIQVRIAEALTVLPLLSPDMIVAVTVGCFITNLIGTGMGLTGAIDIIVGTLATFLAAVCTYKLRNVRFKNIPLLSLLMPIVFNFVFVGAELAWMYNPNDMLRMSLVYGLEVAVGELIAVILGYFLYKALEKTEIFK